MDIDREPLAYLKSILAPKELNNLEEIVFLSTWEGKRYREIAEDTGYQEGYLKDIGSQLWLALAQKLGYPVTKKNLRLILTQYCRLNRLTTAPQPPAEASTYKPEFPGSPLLFASPFYIKRPPIEDRAIATLLQPGSLIRIKAPQSMGKTSFIHQMMGVAAQRGIRTVLVDVQQADTEVLGDLERFLRWFCWNIGQQLNLEPQFEDYWFTHAGSKLSCTTYVQEYFLKQIPQPILVAIDKVHHLVEYPNLAQNFFPLLRSWYEQARVRENWQKLRLIIAHSAELELPIQSHQSPFNVGLPLVLPDLTYEQIKALAARYELHKVGISDFNALEPLLQWIGGHPYLLQLAFYWLYSGYVSLAQLLESAPTNEGIYGEYLRRQWLNLQRNDRWLKAFVKVLTAPNALQLDHATSHRLEGMGLVKFEGIKVSLRCELYRKYFLACWEGEHD